jgi:outer membrane protein assembly factor BamB
VVDQAGKHSDFIASDKDGFMEGLGMKVDEKRGWLWALSVLREGNLFRSKVHAFDLATGETRQQYGIEDTLPHLFNDLAIDEQGNLFITDTYFSAVYKLNPETKKLELFVQSSSLRYPNGITFGNNKLYIATYRNGLVRLDTATREVEKMGGLADTTISYGLDGLVYMDNSLIGVYNIGKEQAENCVIRYRLSKDGSLVEGEEILVKGHHAMADPTTAALSDHSLYVIANSHLDVFNKNKTSTQGIEASLKSLVLLKVDLRR